MRAMVGLVVALATATAAPAFAVQQDPHLGRYEARTIVTGTDLRSRPAGMAVCLGDVLVKVSGDPTILDDPRLPALAAHAADYATGLDYWDRMSGIAHHDEQGSSDRPYNLTVRFDPARIEAALRTLGRAPWPDPRPALVVRVRVQGARDAFDLTEGEARAAGMRAALAESGEKYGMRVIVPASLAAPADGGGAAGDAGAERGGAGLGGRVAPRLAGQGLRLGRQRRQFRRGVPRRGARRRTGAVGPRPAAVTRGGVAAAVRRPRPPATPARRCG